MELSKGSFLQGGKYRIEKVLGQGGFGITYLASMKMQVQGSLGSIEGEMKVAIKEFFMKDLCNRDSDTSHVSVPSVGSKELVTRFRQKFIKEAGSISKLQHPHIVKVIEVFEENNTAYYVMEYLEGDSLNELVKKNDALPEPEALKYIKQIASALDYIHQRSFNHLDVKPENILINAKKNAILIDFGLSKQYDAQGEQTSSTPVGISAGYAPIEQYKQGGVGQFSAPTDIYSLGATLYKLVTGLTPPDALDISNDGLPPLPQHLSTQTRDAIAKAMEPVRRNRLQSIKEFLNRLNDTLGQEEVTVIIESKEPEKIKKAEEVKTFNKEGTPISNLRNFFTGKWGIVLLVGLALVLAGGYFFIEKREYTNKAMLHAADSIRIADSIEAAVSAVMAELAAAEQPIMYTDTDNTTLSVVNPVLQEIANNMVQLAGGTFQMGSEDGEAYDWEKPVHSVFLSFYSISKYEVTQKQWIAVMGSNPSNFKGDNLPVENVSWNDAKSFIQKLNKLTGKGYRLPTEAEWEFAARGGDRSNGYKYSGSNNIGTVAWYDDNSGSKTYPVGQKKPNELGLYDMTGNVWEWCNDWYGSYTGDLQIIPKGPSSGSSVVRRGGSWGNYAQNCRVSSRYGSSAGLRDSYLGFRLCL